MFPGRGDPLISWCCSLILKAPRLYSEILTCKSFRNIHYQPCPVRLKIRQTRCPFVDFAGIWVQTPSQKLFRSVSSASPRCGPSHKCQEPSSLNGADPIVVVLKEKTAPPLRRHKETLCKEESFWTWPDPKMLGSESAKRKSCQLVSVSWTFSPLGVCLVFGELRMMVLLSVLLFFFLF
jgi:hypothetical protein